MPDFKPLYRQSFYEAEHLEEQDEWRESHAENIRCRDFMVSAIEKNQGGLKLGFLPHGGVARKAIAEFGHDRVQWVLANTIQYKGVDDQLFPQINAWAHSIYIPRPTEWERRRDPHLRDDTFDYLLKIDSFYVGGIAGEALERYADLNLFNINHCEPGDIHTKNFEGKLLILRPDKLREEFKQPENQLVYATHGNGCNPNAIGRSVFGYFISDGENTAFDRSDFIGVIDDDHIPEWAVVKLHELQDFDVPDEAQCQSMKGM